MLATDTGCDELVVPAYLYITVTGSDPPDAIDIQPVGGDIVPVLATKISNKSLATTPAGMASVGFTPFTTGLAPTNEIAIYSACGGLKRVPSQT
jgi:hypothetical protein